MLNKWTVGTVCTLLLAAVNAEAGTVSIAGVASPVCGAYDNITVTTSGDVMINNCSSISYAIDAPTSATVNLGITLSVKRTVNSGSALAETLNLEASLANTVLSAATVTFPAASQAGTTTQTITATFPTVATGVVVSAKKNGVVLATTPQITVNAVVTGSCGSFTAYPAMNNAGRTVPETLSTSIFSFGGVTVKELRGGYAVGALAFKVPVETPGSGYWGFQYLEYTGGGRGPVYTAISECSGDMRGAGKANNANDPADDILCRKDPADDSTGVIFSNLLTSRFCKLTPGKTYYYNIRARDLGAEPGMNYLVGTQ